VLDFLLQQHTSSLTIPKSSDGNSYSNMPVIHGNGWLFSTVVIPA